MSGTNRAAIKPGMEVAIVQKKDQSRGELTVGIVRTLLTNSSNHPRGIKVRLESGEIGRVQKIIADVVIEEEHIVKELPDLSYLD